MYILLILYWDCDIRLDVISDCEYPYIVIWHICCLSPVVKAALQYSDIIFWTCNTDLAVLIFVFTEVLSIPTLSRITVENLIVLFCVSDNLTSLQSSCNINRGTWSKILISSHFWPYHSTTCGISNVTLTNNWTFSPLS